MVSVPQTLKGLQAPVKLPRISAGSGAWVAAGIVLLGLSAMLPVLEKSTLTSRGFTLQEHQAREAVLSTEIRELQAEVARLTSMERIERRAAQIGLRPRDLPIHVHVEEIGPEPAKIPAEFLPPPATASEKPESWWRSLVAWVPLP